MSSSPVRVLAVEDERIVARDLAARLKKLGYEVPVVAATGEQAIRLAEELHPGIVLMDIRLPGNCDGVEAARVIRERWDVPVIYVTAHSDDVTLARAGETQPYGYLLKPFHDRELHASIQMALQKHGREKETRDRNLQQSAARHIAHLALASVDIPALLQETALTAARVLAANGAAILELSPERESLVIRTGEGCAAESVGLEEAPASFRKALETSEPLIMEEAEVRATRLGRTKGARSAICAPIPAREERMGILLVLATEVREYSRNEAGFVQNLADSIGLALARHRAQAELESSNAELRKEIERRKRAEEQLVQAQKMEALGRLTGGIAHDFNNILTAVCGYNEMLLEGLADNHELKDYALEVKDAAARAVSLANQMLAFSRRQPMQPRVLDLNDAVRQVSRMLQRLIGEDIRLNVNLQADPATVKADPAQIDQIILNLAVNARDAMHQGGILSIGTSNAVLSGDSGDGQIGAAAGEYIMIALTDTGHGMDAATRRRIFEPFFTTKEQGRGTGLGLSIVYGVVTQNRGEIVVHSEPGKGTTFQIYLPAADPREEVPAPGAEEAALLGDETILLVEDDENVRRFLNIMLVRKGYRVIEAPGPADAIELAEQHRGEIDLILTDIVMPGMAGPELVQAVRASGQRPRAIFMSGYTERSLEEVGIGDIGTSYIQKPFTNAALTRKVREVLDSARRR